MSDAVFSAPVTILVGLGFPCKIRSAKCALAYLDDRPACDRDEAWEATVVACRDALADRTATEETRNVFAVYARRRNILVEDTLPCIKRQIRSRRGA
ncbi:MAG: DUF982 domain-containing protein [Mesorhizobium sp.]